MTKAETIKLLYLLEFEARKLPKTNEIKKFMSDVHDKIIHSNKVNTSIRDCKLCLKEAEDNYKHVTGEDFKSAL